MMCMTPGRMVPRQCRRADSRARSPSLPLLRSENNPPPLTALAVNEGHQMSPAPLTVDGSYVPHSDSPACFSRRGLYALLPGAGESGDAHCKNQPFSFKMR